MRKIYGLLMCVICCCLAVTAHGQYENVWVFGNRAGMDFNGSGPNAFLGVHNFPEACASICDNQGRLFCSTNGNTVWDSNHVVMPNGAALISDFSYPVFGPTSSTSQGALIVPMPDSADKFYIFSLTSIEMGGNYGRLYYSVVNRNLNGGLGDVEPGRKGILLDSMCTELMTATLGDRCNVWVVTTAHLATTWQFRSFEVSGSGINSVPVLSDFVIPVSPSGNYGTMDISPNGKKLGLVWGVPFSFTGRQELYDFSAATGQVSNRVVLDSFMASGYGTCFSPDNSKLYIVDTGLAQYNLSLGGAIPIINSKTYIGHAAGGIIKRGPYGKLYLPGSQALSTINAPNLPGLACLYIRNSLPVAAGADNISSLPAVVPVIKRDTVHSTQFRKAVCFADSYTLQATNDTSGWGYQWYNGTVGPVIMVNGPGTYWLSYHEPPCTYHTDTFHVNFESFLPGLHAVAGCKNDTNAKAWATPASGDTITYNYTWHHNGLVVQGPLSSNHGDTLNAVFNGATYTLEIVAPNGCDTTLEIAVPLPAYQASFTVSDSIICMGDSVAFQNTGQGGFVSLQWDFGTGGTSLLENPRYTYTHAGKYRVRQIARTAYPCYDTAYKNIIVDSLLKAAFFTDRDSICTGQSIVFTREPDSTALSLIWQWGDGTSLSTGNEVMQQHAYDKDGVMPVTLSAQFRACPDTSFTDTVYVYAMPKVYLGPDTVLCLHGAAILLQNLQEQPANAYQLWSTGDTTASIRVLHPGVYNLTVRAAPLGCSTTETITVRKDCYVDIPNAFTPNDDGINDYFFPRQLLSGSITAFRMQVYNRWGQVIFETDRTDGRGWDGRFNNKEQPQGVYIYRIDVSIEGTAPEHYQGNVTLLR